MEDAHAKTTEEVLKHFQTNPELGLTPEQIKQYQAKYGPNGKWKIIIFYSWKFSSEKQYTFISLRNIFLINNFVTLHLTSQMWCLIYSWHHKMLFLCKHLMKTKLILISNNLALNSTLNATLFVSYTQGARW